MIVHGQRRLRPERREDLAIMIDLTAEIERKLGLKGYDIPDLEPAITEAREHAAKLHAWVSELNWLAETEHGEDRRIR